MESYLRIGRVLKPQGIKGELKVEPLTDDPERFKSIDTFYIERPGSYVPYHATRANARDGFVYISLDGIGDRNAAELLRNSYLCVIRKDALQLPEDTYFIHDLLGSTVYSDDGKKLGVLQEVIRTGANDVFSIRSDRGELLVPAIKKVVRLVDTDQKRITLDGAALKEVSDFAD